MLRKMFILSCVTVASFGTASAQIPDVPQLPQSINATLLAEVTEKGAKVTGIALEYEDNVFSGTDLRQIYQIQTALEQADPQARTLLRAYVNDKPTTAHQAKPGRFVILELDERDKNADFYSLRVENNQPMTFKAKDKAGQLVEIEKVQAN